MSDKISYINTLKKIGIKQEDLFYIASKCYLISKIRTEENNGDDILKFVYPYIFEDDITDYDSSEMLEVINGMSKEKSNDFIGELYENMVSVKVKKDIGMFYTREDNVTNYMIVLSNINSRMKILEPSCGSGIFALNILDKIINKSNDIEEDLINFFTNIHCNDFDMNACKITEINILAKSIDVIKKIYKKNSSFKLPKLNITCSDFIDFKDKEKYDLVIGNPPYVTFYGKRSRNMTEEKRRRFNSFDFVINKNGNNKFNMLMFFVENGLKSLKKNGKLVFIIDFAFFETAFIDLRKYLVNNYTIESITENMSEFDDVASGQVIISIINCKPTAGNIVKWIDFSDNSTIEVNQTLWNDEKNKYKIYKPLSGLTKQINEKCNRFKTLDFYYPNKCLRTCCALTGKTEEFLVDKNKKTDNVIFPYLEGSKGLKCKFGKPTTSKYIEYDYQKQLDISEIFKQELEKLGVKNKKRVTLGDKEVYLSPKLFIRQSSTQVICTYTEKPFAANNSLYVLSNKSDDDYEKTKLKYLCGILNSDLISYYARVNNIIRYGLGKQPQIKTSDFKQIRIAFDEKYFLRVVELVDLLLEKCDSSNMEELNKIVYKIYSINDDEIKCITDYLKKDDI